MKGLTGKGVGLSLFIIVTMLVLVIYGAFCPDRGSEPQNQDHGISQKPRGLGDLVKSVTFAIISPAQAKRERELQSAKERYLRGERQAAKESINRILLTYNGEKESRLLLDALTDAGNFFASQGDTPAAIEYLSRAVDIAASTNNDKRLKELLTTLEPLYAQQETGGFSKTEAPEKMARELKDPSRVQTSPLPKADIPDKVNTIKVPGIKLDGKPHAIAIPGHVPAAGQ